MEFDPTVTFIARREMLRIAAGVDRWSPGRSVLSGEFTARGNSGHFTTVVRKRSGRRESRAFRDHADSNQPLSTDLTMLSGPGGNVVVLNGADGKLMGDTFVMPAWPHLKEALARSGMRR